MSDRKKTIYLTVTNDLTYDQRMQRICTSLVGFGWQVYLVGRELPTSVPLKNQSFTQIRLKCWWTKGKWFYVEYNIRLLCFLWFRRMDVLCAIDLDTLLAGFLVSHLRRRILVYDAHEYFTEVPEVVRRPGIQRVWEHLADWIIPKLRYCYTVGPELAKIFETRYGPSFEVIRNVPFQQPLLQEARSLEGVSHPILLYQGALNEGRGIEFLLEAMLQLPTLQLWLVGEGDLSEVLRARHQELQLGAQVRFWGFVEPDELKSITAQAHIGFNLLENKGLSYYYSLANKAFDYVQAGIPSLQMAFPEYLALQQEREVFVLLQELTVEAIVASVQQLLQKDNGLYARLAQNCLVAASHWTWENESKKLQAFYQKLSGH